MTLAGHQWYEDPWEGPPELDPGEVSYQPFERLGFAAWYSYESISDNHTSRNSPAGTFAPATNDWFSRFKSGASTAGATANIVLWPELVDLQLNWIFETAQNNTLTTGASAASAAFGWPQNGDNLLSIGPTLAVHVTDHLTLRGTYRYERYRLDDFQINNLSAPTCPSPARTRRTSTWAGASTTTTRTSSG